MQPHFIHRPCIKDRVKWILMFNIDLIVGDFNDPSLKWTKAVKPFFALATPSFHTPLLTDPSSGLNDELRKSYHFSPLNVAFFRLVSQRFLAGSTYHNDSSYALPLFNSALNNVANLFLQRTVRVFNRQYESRSLRFLGRQLFLAKRSDDGALASVLSKQFWAARCRQQQQNDDALLGNLTLFSSRWWHTFQRKKFIPWKSKITAWLSTSTINHILEAGGSTRILNSGVVGIGRECSAR
ncbi:hypothetical protein ACOME3_008785 [Neoechinorhynchus agilis]